MLRAPLSVHVAGLGGEQHLDVSDVEFSRDARGGYGSATFSVPAWVDSSDGALGPVSRVMIDDGRTGRRVFEGYLDIPGKTVDRSGHTWKIGAVGASSVLGDRAAPYVAIDADLSGWAASSITSPGSTAEVSSLPADDTVPALVLQFPAGQPVDNLSTVKMYYPALFDNGQQLGGAGYTRVAGKADGNYRLKAAIREVGGAFAFIRDAAFGLTVNTVADEITTSWANPANYFSLQISHDTGGATNVATDNVWGAFSAVWVRAQFRNLAGVYKAGTGDHIDPWVLAHDVVIDALSTFSNQIDIAGASIDRTFAEQISQLAYPDPVRLPDILSDLALVEPDMVWEVLESNSAGKHRFNLRRWPTDVRYEADTVDGWESPGSEFDLSTNATVSWVTANGKTQTYDATFAVPALAQWGRSRDIEIIDLGSELGGVVVASAITDALAAKMATVPYAGTLTVARPVRDLYLGRDVEPWEIVPGYLLNVRDIDAPPMQLSEVSYRDSDMSATLTLGTPTFSLDALLAKLARRRTRRLGKPKALAST